MPLSSFSSSAMPLVRCANLDAVLPGGESYGTGVHSFTLLEIYDNDGRKMGLNCKPLPHGTDEKGTASSIPVLNISSTHKEAPPDFSCPSFLLGLSSTRCLALKQFYGMSAPSKHIHGSPCGKNIWVHVHSTPQRNRKKYGRLRVLRYIASCWCIIRRMGAAYPRKEASYVV